MARQQHWTFLFYKCLIILQSIFYCCCAQYYTFTKDPQSVIVAKGQTATLYCEWTPILFELHVARWLHFSPIFVSKGYEEIDSSNENYNFTTGLNFLSLSIFKVEQHDTGLYQCEIDEDGYYTNSKRAFVKLVEITCNPENDNGEIGTTLTCSYTSSHMLDSIELIWYRNEIPFGSNIQDNILESRPLTAEDDGAVFTCNAFIGHQVIGTCETTPLVLNINAEIEQSPPGPIQAGDNFTHTCSGKKNSDHYEYEWKWNNKIVSTSPSKSRFATGNVLTVRNVSINANGKIVTCTISRSGRNDSTTNYTIKVLEDTIRLQSTPGTQYPVTSATNNVTDEPQTLIIVIGVVAIAIVILITAIIICILYKRRKRQYDKKKQDDKKTKPESVPLKEPMYDNIEQDIENGPLRETLKTDLSIYDEPTISNSNTQLETMYAEPDTLVTGHDARYDTPRNAISLDNIDSANTDEASDTKPRKTKSRESIDAMYAKPNKSRSKESIDDLYSQPNKPNANTSIEAHSKESIDDLYAKPNKSTTNTPDPTKKNVEGLTYADIEFKSGTFPTPEPQDYGLDYATVQTIK